MEKYFKDEIEVLSESVRDVEEYKRRINELKLKVQKEKPT